MWACICCCVYEQMAFCISARYYLSIHISVIYRIYSYHVQITSYKNGTVDRKKNRATFTCKVQDAEPKTKTSSRSCINMYVSARSRAICVALYGIPNEIHGHDEYESRERNKERNTQWLRCARKGMKNFKEEINNSLEHPRTYTRNNEISVRNDSKMQGK